MKRWLALAGLLVLAGCASWGGNVRGDFACKAPQGTCAPTAEIDARAVERATRSQWESGGNVSLPRAWPTRTVKGEAMGRTGERVLRIVFFPHIDEAGHFHESAVLHAVVEGSGWQERLADAPPVPAEGGDAAEPAIRQVEVPARRAGGRS